MHVGAALRRHDHDLPPDVAVNQRNDPRLPAFPSNRLQQQRGRELVPSDFAQIDDVTLGSAGIKIIPKMLTRPVAPGTFNLGGGNYFLVTHKSALIQLRPSLTPCLAINRAARTSG